MELKDQLNQVVEAFFKGFDEKNTGLISEVSHPDIKIIHHNGVVTDLTEMNRIIDTTQHWYPRRREISEFEVMAGAPYSIAGFKNYVAFTLPDKTVEEIYRETWVFLNDPISKMWKPIRIHYSAITQNKHSEEVK